MVCDVKLFLSGGNFRLQIVALHEELTVLLTL